MDKIISPEKLVTLGTSIATCLAKDIDISELNQLKNLVGQIQITLNNIYLQRLILLQNKE